MPFLLSQHYLQDEITVDAAKRNLADYIKFYDNLRDPLSIDLLTNFLYRCFHESEMLVSEDYHLRTLVFGREQKSLGFGRDLFNQEVFRGKSEFSKNFFQINKTLF